MRPRFHETLTIDADGKLEQASGPIDLEQFDREAYIWVQVAQDQPGGRHAVEQIGKIENLGGLITAAAGGTPSWSLAFEDNESERGQVTPGRFEEGPARAEAWLVVLRSDVPDTSHIVWSANVRLAHARPAA